jgi:hypothetical protein
MGGFSKRKRERETFVRALDKTLLFASVGKLGPWESSVNRAQGGEADTQVEAPRMRERERERERESRYLLGRGRRGERREEEEKPKEKHFFDF